MGTPLTPLNEVNVMRRTAVIHHQPTPHDTVRSQGILLKTRGGRSRSVSESGGSDYVFTPFGNETDHSLSHSESTDLNREVTQHLERMHEDDGKNDNEMRLGDGMHRKIRSDSMLPSELKKKYKTKIKQIGKHKIINNDNLVANTNANANMNMNMNASDGDVKGVYDGNVTINESKVDDGKSMEMGKMDANDNKKKKNKIKWRRRKNKKEKKKKTTRSVTVDSPSGIIDENREIDNNYFVDKSQQQKQVSLTPNSKSRSRSNGNVLTTPSREYSTSTSADSNPFYNGIHAHSDNEESGDDKPIDLSRPRSLNENDKNASKLLSEDELALKQIQITKFKQSKKQSRSSALFSRFFSKIQTWTDKNRQAFTAYSQILKTAITQQVT